MAEQKLSAQRSQARDQGKQFDPRPVAEPVGRPASEKETSRLLAKDEVAREHLAHLIRTDATDKEIKWAARTVHELLAVLDKTRAARKEMGRERMPQVVYTTEEWKQLKEYGTSRDMPVKDDHSAARLQSGCVIAGAELKDTQGKADAFQASRHFWKFDVEGWDRGLSLKEVEQAIKTKSEERLKLYNFLRPSKRETIQDQIEYLLTVKKDLQKQLATKELGLGKSLAAAEARYKAATNQVELTQEGRAAQGKRMPAPAHHKDELAKLEAIASRNKDGAILGYVYDLVRDRLLENPSQEALSRVRGRAIMARMEMLKAAQRFAATDRFGDYRQLPVKDRSGLDHTKSIREASPKTALETIIRHFTDNLEQKREQKEVRDIAQQQLRRAEEQSIKTRDFSVVLDRILKDYCRAGGVSQHQIQPLLTSQEIAEVREFADKMYPVSSIRREFTDAARQAEQGLQEREAAEAAREAQQARSHDPTARTREQPPTLTTPITDRADHDTSWRGR